MRNQTKTHSTSSVQACQNCKKDFTIETEDFNFYEKIKVPPPTFCPECRLIRRLAWRNERSLYKRSCDLCSKKIISMYSGDVSFPVYCPSCWKSDSWDRMQFGREYDFSKTFFEQFKSLLYQVPRQSVWQNGECVNTEYTNFAQDAKNVYLAYSIVYGSENVSYSSNVDNSKDIIDGYNILDSELIYEGIGNTKNYNSRYCYWSSNCIDSSYMLDCVNCSNCFGCINLQSKRYCIWNKQYRKEEYENKIKEYDLGSFFKTKEIIKQFWSFSLKFPRKYTRIVNSVNTIGDELRDCKNSLFVFNAYHTEDIKFAFRAPRTKDSMDVSYIGKAELAYEHAFGGSENSQGIKFIINGAPANSEVEYSDLCQSSNNLFGCVGLISKQYCILNKQYPKEEYITIVKKIKQHMSTVPFVDSKGRNYFYGEFFPMEFSFFGYNETLANELFPLTKEEIIERGYNWRGKSGNTYTITIKALNLPDNIKDVDDSVLNEVIECSQSKKAFRIIASELQFYRRMNVALPRLHPDERYKNRLKLRNPLKLWHRKCMKEGCPNTFETSYASDRPEIVYCEKCYQQEVY